MKICIVLFILLAWTGISPVQGQSADGQDPDLPGQPHPGSSPRINTSLWSLFFKPHSGTVKPARPLT
jgi:hypothetical protein